MKTALSLATATLLILPLCAHPDADTEPGQDSVETVFTGNGLWRYSTVPQWGTLPESVDIGPTHGGVAVDAAGRVYVSTDAAHGICVFESDGTFLKTLGEGTQMLHSLVIIEKNGQEVLLGAAESQGEARTFTLDGELLSTVPNAATGIIKASYQVLEKGWPSFAEDGTPIMGDPMDGITAAVVSPSGDMFIACGYGSNLVHKFDSEGKHVASMGGPNPWHRETLPGLFRCCHGLAIDTRFGEPRLLVVDRENGRLLHYTLDLKPLGVHAEGLRRPCAVSFYGGDMAVAELAGRVTVLDKMGVPVAFLGDNPITAQRANFSVPKNEMKEGLFTAPHGLTYDAGGNLIVQDWNVTGRVTMLQHLKNPGGK